jgi:predicted glycoside hydrolase/deacetylase ChbG (UPF0249 family)
VAVTTESPRLIINADDFGFTDDINRGIIEAFEAGALTSTSIMIAMPAAEHAAQYARATNALGVGLHLTLTAGRPLTMAPSLVNHATGYFLRPSHLLARAIAGRLRAREIVDECTAQIGRARRLGLRLTHIDGHHHVHLYPVIRRAVRHVIAAERIPVVRRPAEHLVGVPEWRRRLPERIAIRLFARGVGAGCWHAETTRHFVGSTLLGAPRFHSALVRVLDELPSGTTELMVHPGYVAGPLPGGDSYTTQREIELRALTSPDVLQRLRSGRIRLINFRQLSERP